MLVSGRVSYLWKWSNLRHSSNGLTHGIIFIFVLPQKTQRNNLQEWSHCTIWLFPKIGVPENGWFIMEHPLNILLKWMIWSTPYFRKHPYFISAPGR